MRITIDGKSFKVPDWAEGRPIYFFAANEPFALICSDQPNVVWVKTKRCNLCGQCCIVDEGWFYGWKNGVNIGFPEGTKVCKHLHREVWNFDEYENQVVYVCKATLVPMGCCKGPSCTFPDFKKDFPECSLEFKAVR